VGLPGPALTDLRRGEDVDWGVFNHLRRGEQFAGGAVFSGKGMFSGGGTLAGKQNPSSEGSLSHLEKKALPEWLFATNGPEIVVRQGL